MGVQSFFASVTSYASYWLIELDLFGYEVGMHIDCNKKFRTHVGGFCTILVACLTVYFGQSSIINCITQSDGVYYNLPQYTADPGIFSFDSTSFIFAVGFEDPSITLIDSPYIDLTINLINVSTPFSASGYPQNKMTNISITNLGVQKCASNYFKSFSQVFNSFGIGSMYCPNVTSFEVGGSYMTTNYSYLKISLSFCQNDSVSSVVCASQDAINSYLSNISMSQVKFHIYFQDNTIEISNLNSPMSSFINSYSWSISPGISKETSLFLKEVDIISDRDIWLQEPNLPQMSRQAFDYSSLDDISVINQSGDFLTLNLKKSLTIYQFKRTYKKVSDVLAFLGGLGKLLFALASIFALWYNQFQYYLRISNEIYDFELNKLKQAKKPHKVEKKEVTLKRKVGLRPGSSITSLIDVGPNNNSVSMRRRNGINSIRELEVEDEPKAIKPDSQTFQDFTIYAVTKGLRKSKAYAISRYEKQTEIINKYRKELGEFLNNSKLNFKIKEVMNLLICWKSRVQRVKENFYNQSSTKVKEDCDIVNILKKLQDIDKIKHFLFTEPQQQLFNYRKPPLIEYKDQYTRYIRLLEAAREKKNIGNRVNLLAPSESFDNIGKYYDLCRTYLTTKIALNKDHDQVSHQLLDMFEPDLKVIFEKIYNEYKRGPNLNMEEMESSSESESKESIIRGTGGSHKKILDTENHSPIMNMHKQSSENEIEDKIDMNALKIPYSRKGYVGDVMNSATEIRKESTTDMGYTRSNKISTTLSLKLMKDEKMSVLSEEQVHIDLEIPSLAESGTESKIFRLQSQSFDKSNDKKENTNQSAKDSNDNKHPNGGNDKDNECPNGGVDKRGLDGEQT